MKTLFSIVLFIGIITSAFPINNPEVKTPRYILTLELSQSHFSLSLTKLLADAANKCEFEIAVDQKYYESVTVGQELVDSFRTGSLVLKGSFGNWHVKVLKKKAVI